VPRLGAGTAPVNDQPLNDQPVNDQPVNGQPSARPIGVARGSSSLALAWVIAASIALLTGATSVVIMLAIGLVAFVASIVTGWRAVRRATVYRVEAAGGGAGMTVGDDAHWHVRVRGVGRVHVELLVVGQQVAAGWVEPGTNTLGGTAPSRGEHTEVLARWSSAGGLGLVWWRRTTELAMPTIVVAPAAAAVGAQVDRLHADHPDDATASTRAGRADVDGVRNWRDGDELSAVHWPSTLRSGEFVVRQRLMEVDETWVIDAQPGTADPDAEAGRVRARAEEALSVGAKVAVRVGADDPVPLDDGRAVLRWCATFEPVVHRPVATPWWRRQLGQSPEPARTLHPRARWAAGAAAAVPLMMLLEPLGYDPVRIAVVLLAVATGAACSIGRAQQWKVARPTLGLLTAAAVGAALIDLSAITGVAGALRFLLPQLLVTLVVLQGFECLDRRAARVSLACSAMLIAYASGIRVDSRLTIWLTAAMVGLAIAAQSVTKVDRALPRAALATGRIQSATRRPVALLGAGVAVLAVLALLPVPEGPAQLTLPSWLDDYRPTPSDGRLVAADGSPLLGGGRPSGDRDSVGGGIGGYPGFSPTMDVNLRGDLGNTVVLRVRSPYADFWRGQTFTRFDGRTWYVDAEVGTRTEGPDHRIAAADGDVRRLTDEPLIQTFYAQVDMPNIVFAATRAERVLLEAPLRARPDGALRAEAVLPAGSVYTVVSQRSGATADGLRGDGNLAQWESPPEYLEVPDGLTERTHELALQLAAGVDNTYDLILAIHEWLRANVEYNLDAPVPPGGADAVDHFLFESQQGFCEQIATATAMLLRSVGVPARVATGYVPSSRDSVAGVWVSRASDAHAWVEVRFPNFGWVAFDPTASVPLAGESAGDTIGAAIARALASTIGNHLPLVLGVSLAGAALLLGTKAATAWWQRRRRGRWGVLQDRFVETALRRGGSPTAANAELAAVFDQSEAHELAAALDASAFSANWVDDEADYNRAVTDLAALSGKP